METLNRNLKDVICDNLKKFRKEAGLKQWQVAKKIFRSLKVYQSYEEKRCSPSIETLHKLASLYKKDINEFLC